MASFYVLTFRCHWWAGVRSGYDLACGSPLRLSARKEPAHWDPPYERREERDPPAGSFGGSISGYVFSRVADDETFVSDSRTSPDVDPPLPPFVGPWWAARMGENGWTGKEYLENQPKEMEGVGSYSFKVHPSPFSGRGFSWSSHYLPIPGDDDERILPARPAGPWVFFFVFSDLSCLSLLLLWKGQRRQEDPGLEAPTFRWFLSSVFHCRYL